MRKYFLLAIINLIIGICGVQAQNFDTACTPPLQPLPALTIRNPNDNNLQANGCMDVNGKLQTLQGVPVGSATIKNVKQFGALGDTRQLPLTVYNPIGFPTGKILAGFPVSTFTQSDVGKFIGCVEGASGLFRAGGTIVTVDSDTQVTITNVVNQGAGGGTECYLGHFDDVPFAAAYSAAFTAGLTNCPILDGTAATWNGSGCSSLYIPCGGYLLSKPFTPGGLISTNILTDKERCTTIFMYSFWDTSSISPNQGMLWSFLGQYQENFTLTGSGISFSAPNNPVVVYQCVHCEIHGPNITAVANGNSQAIFSLSNGGGQSVYINPMVRDVGAGAVSGGVLCDINGIGSIDIYGIFCSNGFVNLRITNVTGGATASRLSFHGGQIDECGVNSATIGCTQIINSKDISFYGTGLISGSNNLTPGISVDATSEVRLSGNYIGPFGGNSGSGISVASGGKVWYTQTNLKCVNASATCVNDQNPINSPGAIDVGGNKYAVSGGATKFGGTALPYASLTHNYNTCYVTGTFGAVNLCLHYLDTTVQLLRIKASSGAAITCTVNPVVTISDGTGTQNLTITTGASSWDSGALASNVTYTLGNTLTVSTTAGTCTVPPTNFSVTYNTQALGAQ